jgi:hypothetical protein
MANQTQVQIDREAVLVAKQSAHKNDSAQPVLTGAEQAELSTLQAM